MAAPSLDSEFRKYWLLLTAFQKQSLLSVVKSFVQADTGVERINLERYNRELAEAEQEVERGDFIRHDQLLKEINGW